MRLLTWSSRARPSSSVEGARLRRCKAASSSKPCLQDMATPTIFHASASHKLVTPIAHLFQSFSRSVFLACAVVVCVVCSAVPADVIVLLNSTLLSSAAQSFPARIFLGTALDGSASLQAVRIVNTRCACTSNPCCHRQSSQMCASHGPLWPKSGCGREGCHC